MKKILVTFVLIFTVALSTFCQALLDKSGWYLFKSDEFNYVNYSQLYQNWNSGWPWSTCQKDVCNLNFTDLPSNITLDGNYLHLKAAQLSTPIACGNNTSATYGTASIWSKFGDSLECGSTPGFMHGMFEARLKMAKGNGMYSSFWMTGQTAWPPEIDVFEFNGRSPSKMFSTPHWTSSNYQASQVNCVNSLTLSSGVKSIQISGGWTIEPGQKILIMYDNTRKMTGQVLAYDNSTGICSVSILSADITGSGTFSQWKVDCLNGDCLVSTFVDKGSSGGFDDEFHTYTCVWTPSEITWFYDGKEYRREMRQTRIPQTDCTWRKMMPTFGLAANCLDNINQTGDMTIDYFRVYKPLSSNTTWNHFQNNYQTIDNNPHLLYASEPNNTASSKIVVTNTGNVFYKGTDNRLWNYYWNGSSFSSVPISWSVTDVFSDITHDQTNSLIYYRNTLNKLSYFSNGNSFIANNTQNCGGFLSIDQYAGVYYRGTDNFMYYSKKIGSVYSNTKINVINNVGGSICNNANTIYYRGTDNNLWRSFYTLSTNSWSSPVMLTFTGNLTNNLIWSNDRLYYSGFDKRVYNFYFDGSNWQNACMSWANDDANCEGDLAADRVNGRDCVYYRGSDGRLWYFFSDKGWALANGGTIYNSASSSILNVGGPIAVRSDGIVYYRGTDNKMYENWLQASNKTNILGNSPTSNNNTVFKKEEEEEVVDVDFQSKTYESKISVYPNPFSDDVTLSFGKGINVSDVEIKIYDSYGILQKINSKLQVDNKVKLELSSLSSGLYFYNLSYNGQSESGSILKK